MSRPAIESDYEFGAYDDDYRGFEIRDDESNRGPLILALALGILIVFGAVVWNTYRQGVRTSENGLPIIASAESPYKRTPDNPGGAVTPDTDRRIYDQMDGGTRPLTQNAAAVGPAQQTLPELSQADSLDGGLDASLSGDPIVITGAQKLETLRGGVKASDGQKIASLRPMAPVQVPQRVEPVVQPVPEPPVKKARFAFENGGAYLVQISALRTNEAAERAWRDATRKTPDLFEGAEKRIQRADLGAKGVFYRLRVGAFSERSNAVDFCNALKSAKHQCIVVQN